jgi:hypothetical protein
MKAGSTREDALTGKVDMKLLMRSRDVTQSNRYVVSQLSYSDEISHRKPESYCHAEVLGHFAAHDFAVR